ncbi:2-oxoisovalerate dehydrogenase E1 subunit beta [[Phormidium ambiguum] IAM M-71]|uniref:2-oxoisovalerate dehydrogenase E1 subunit beta n=1 Tax=[Phormidium ambiguum] IAM M-71 TaxID=454136 RepID=A0A1U7IHM4_9CYAN|nr:2-oxoisovalerate dehydrogenase E1 subunit beta [Phormidium ambiguum]OKH36638.1 2-oxoisovalerate dehydrogenase E1 subunit beta [Phormidium ambiguum IAM M-71]
MNNSTKTEIVFLVEDDPEVGYNAKALSESIFTQADDLETLREMVLDAVRCHFPDEKKRPKVKWCVTLSLTHPTNSI